jgi:hypothetical protein
MYALRPGRASYGHTVGIIMQDDQLVRFPGDVGNLATYDFAVTFAHVHDFPMEAMSTPGLVDHAPKFVSAAEDLVKMGCTAISAGCGFTALLQPYVAAAVDVPVALSALIQVPLVHAMLPPGRSVGIVTANSRRMTEAHFNAVGWSSESIPIMMIGVDEDEEASLDGLGLGRNIGDALAFAEAETAMVRLGRRLVDRDAAVGAIVFECTNMPPFAAAVQAALNLPVFDIVTLVNMLHEGVARRPYPQTSFAVRARELVDDPGEPAHSSAP